MEAIIHWVTHTLTDKVSSSVRCRFLLLFVKVRSFNM